MEYRDLMKKTDLKALCERSIATELRRFAQGMRDIKGTKMYFISKSAIHHGRRKEMTYGRIVVKYKPEKFKKHRTRLTDGEDRLVCLVDAGTPTADVPTKKS